MHVDDRELRTALERSGHGIGAEDFVRELERELRSRKSGTGGIGMWTSRMQGWRQSGLTKRWQRSLAPRSWR
jgi:hypothetical protein